jgi:hypothetical protein
MGIEKHPSEIRKSWNGKGKKKKKRVEILL